MKILDYGIVFNRHNFYLLPKCYKGRSMDYPLYKHWSYVIRFLWFYIEIQTTNPLTQLK